VTQATRTGQLTFADYLERAWRETALWALIVAALYLVVALVTYSPQDPGWSQVGMQSLIHNAGGAVGAWFADITLYLFGLFAYLIPITVAWSAYLIFRQRVPEPETKLLWLVLRWVGFLLLLAAGSALLAIHVQGFGPALPNGVGGGLGLLIADHTLAAFGAGGGSLFLSGLLLIGFTLFTGLSPLGVLDGVGELALSALRVFARGAALLKGLRWPAWRRGSDAEDADFEAPPRRLLGPVLDTGPSAPVKVAPDVEAATPPAPPVPKRAEAKPAKREAKAPPKEAADRRRPLSRPLGGRIEGRPPLELLDPSQRSGLAVTAEQLEGMSRELEARLAEFGVVAEVVEVHPGPVVALFELELAPGVKVSKITGLAKDIARALSKVSVRVVEVIPGKSVIGLEVPNDQREMVYLSENLSSRAYQEAKSPLTIAMGTNISGEPVIADLGRMPHALIAGTTGSGKSVAINAMILSLVYKASADEVRLIMVDPKMLELSVYEGIPHLLTPVVTDMKEAANALRWCVGEMERRYRLMASLGVRNIAGYNRKVQEAIDAGEPLPDPTFNAAEAFTADGEPPEVPTLQKLPYIVVIIDELADMMMVVGKKVEELIARLAQKARASGIHLLLATQRPSVDVLTGLIKANIPTRMAFKVSARVDSRTVLDQMGAEHLLGHGDMLYLPPGGSIPQRVHGAFVDDHEVHRVVDYLKQQGVPDYIETILQERGEHLPGIDPEPKGGGDVEDQDPLFDEAVQIVVESRRASISGVQRRLKIGYNRAARMIEEMERIGIVGPAETNGNREVLAPQPPEG